MDQWGSGEAVCYLGECKEGLRKFAVSPAYAVGSIKLFLEAMCVGVATACFSCDPVGAIGSMRLSSSGEFDAPRMRLKTP